MVGDTARILAGRERQELKLRNKCDETNMAGFALPPQPSWYSDDTARAVAA